MKTIICEKKQMIERAAERIRDLLTRGKSDGSGPVLALACGQTMEPLWSRLVELCQAGELSFEKTRVLCVTEFVGVGEERSCRFALENGLLRHVDVKPENCFFPKPDAPEDYDRLIERLGGIDLAVLGLGEDCHIGYNEPGTLFDTKTHVQKLTDRTKRQLLKRGFSESDMPQQAVTMGIKTLTGAREILLLACGGEKAGAVYQTLYAKTTPYIPAAYLQIPLEVTAFFDTGAAEKLKEEE